MSEINWWLETYKLLPATIIGFCVAVVAFLQWRTAHAKLMVDLFDKRLEIYETVIEAVTLSNSDDGSGKQATEATYKLYRARSGATFLFGKLIAENINEIVTSLNVERRNERRLRSQNISEDDRNRFAEEAEKAGNLKDRLTRQFQQACIPYMLFEHKSRSSIISYNNSLTLATIFIVLLLLL